jgi:hypothetical protein
VVENFAEYGKYGYRYHDYSYDQDYEFGRAEVRLRN